MTCQNQVTRARHVHVLLSIVYLHVILKPPKDKNIVCANQIQTYVNRLRCFQPSLSSALCIGHVSFESRANRRRASIRTRFSQMSAGHIVRTGR